MQAPWMGEWGLYQVKAWAQTKEGGGDTIVLWVWGPCDLWNKANQKETEMLSPGFQAKRIGLISRVLG